MSAKVSLFLFILLSESLIYRLFSLEIYLIECKISVVCNGQIYEKHYIWAPMNFQKKVQYYEKSMDFGVRYL